MKTYIYVLKDPITLDIRYVGKTTCLKRRFRSHKCLKADKGVNLRAWIESLISNGLSPLIEHIDIVDMENAEEKEIYYIKFYKNKGCNLVNETEGGRGSKGYRHTEEARNKMTLWQIGRVPKFIPSFVGKKHSDESKIKISTSQLGEKNHNYGKEISKDAREKISASLGTKVTINDIIYPSMREAARMLGMGWSTFKYRYKNELI